MKSKDFTRASAGIYLVFNKINVIRKKVQFNNDVQIISIPYEERKGIWMQYAIDRAHFKRRIDQVEILLSPILLLKLNNLKTSEGKCPPKNKGWERLKAHSKCPKTTMRTSARTSITTHHSHRKRIQATNSRDNCYKKVMVINIFHQIWPDLTSCNNGAKAPVPY